MYGKMLLASALSAAALFLQGCSRVPPKVRIDGVDVGGMRYEQAERAVRERWNGEIPTLTLRGRGTYTFSAPEIGYTDELYELVRRVGPGEYDGGVAFYLKGCASVLCRIAAEERVAPQDASVSFSKDGFCYEADRSGRRVDEAQLSLDVTAALRTRSDATVDIPFVEERAERTEEDVRRDTACLASFSTVYDPNAEGRAHNIRLACGKIDGTTLAPHASFSFNAAVGRRTAENGFREAKVISDGKFVSGVGGGVCQVSTTLYNCALLSGMKVTESSAHSLQVGYVPPSFDAMVSDTSDLRFDNPYDMPVYLACKASDGKLTVTVYGRSDGMRYECESVIKRTIAPPEPKIVEGEEEKVLRAAKEGLVSEGYLRVYRGDVLLERRKLRADSYLPVQEIRQKPMQSD